MSKGKAGRRPRIAHKPPSEPRSATISPEYQAEVDRAMERGRLRWEHEQAELAKAERRRARLAAAPKPKSARAARSRQRELRELDEWIELERARLQRLDNLMRTSPQSAAHRGRKSYRPVPKQGDLI